MKQAAFSPSAPAGERWTRWSIAVPWTVTIILVAALLISTPGAWGQDNATINGTVTDASGALVPNATLTLKNPATGQARESVSNSAGAYRFANVGVGTYSLTVSAQGFQKFTKTDIVVNVAQTLEENVSLAVGSQEQTVSVAADALQVQTETSEVSTLISGQQVSELSTNGRNITSLAALGMGVSNNLPQYGGIDALTSSNAISFNGARQTHNIYMIDNAEQNDRGCGGCFMNLPSQDAIAEFQTLDSNYTPDYGVGSGGTILMVLKGGTKSFHGELYEFNRNTAYNANDYFNKTGATPKPRSTFKLNEPGGNIGGPLWIPHVYNDARSRTFFFVNEEWRKLVQGSAPSPINTILAGNFPTAGQDLTYTPWNEQTLKPSTPPNTGLCNDGVQPPCVPKNVKDPNELALFAADGLTPGEPFPNNVIPANLIDQNAVLELNSGTFPKPNDGPNQYIASIPAPENIREDVVRIDHSINSKYQLMGHYLHDAMTKSFFPPLWGPGGDYPTVGTAMTNPSYTAAIRLTQTYTPNLLNETAFLYSGNKITLTPVAGAGNSFTLPSGWTANSFFPVANNAGHDMPEIDLQGSPLQQTWTESYYPWKNGYEGFDYRDDLSWTKGRHQFKFGFAWLHDYKNQQLQANTQGTAAFNSNNFSGDGYVNFLLGMASSFTQLEFLAGKHWVNNNYGFYGNDNWHVTPRLTLNLGLRFDGLPHAFERYDLFSNFVPADYDTSLGNPLKPDGTINQSQLSTFSKTGSELFYLNGIREANVGGFPRGNVQNSYKTWQPRIGFAYNLTGNGKTVLRGGYGMFFERVQGNDVYNAALNPPFAYQPSANNVYFSNPNASPTNPNPGANTQQYFPSNMTTLKYNYPNPGTGDWSFGLQREVARSVVAVIQYVGSTGWDQNNDRQINALPLADLTDRQKVAGGANANLYRNYPGYAHINQEENETNFNYHSLQAGIRAESRHGLTTQLSYTWSHNISIVVNDLGGLSNPYNAAYDRGSDTGFDRRHIFNASYVYAMPFFSRSQNILARTVLGNWEISGITAVEAGLPQFVTYNGANTLGLGEGTNRPDKVASVSYPKKVSGWYSTSSFAAPIAPWNGGPNQGFGNAGKDSVVGPGLFNWNLSLFKSIPLRESGTPKFELRFESFNTFNHTEFQGLDNTTGDKNFGAVTSDYGPRLLELGGKFVF